MEDFGGIPLLESLKSKNCRDLADDTTWKVRAIAKRIQSKFIQPFQLNTHQINIGTSIGITFSTMNYRLID
jgi:GGDEF domain-containing protein